MGSSKYRRAADAPSVAVLQRFPPDKPNRLVLSQTVFIGRIRFQAAFAKAIRQPENERSEFQQS